MPTQIMTLAIVLLYFVIMLLVGWAAEKMTRNMSDYMVSGRGLGVWMLSFGVMAAVMSGWSWLGNPGAVYDAGYSAAVKITSLTPAGVVLAFVFIAKPIRIISNHTECFTMPDILAARWNNNSTIRLLSCIIILIGSATYLVSQWSAMGTVMQMVLGISYEWGVVVGAVIITAYVVAGGMLASMWTNFVQMIIMFLVAILIMVKCVGAVGGFEQMNLTVSAIDQSYVSPFNESYGIINSLSYSILVVFLAYGGQPGLNTKFLMIKDHRQLRWSPLISVIAMIVGTSMYVVGLVGVIMVERGEIAAPATPDGILLSVTSAVFSPTVNALIMVAVMAAVMSTAETHLFTSATSIVQDFAIKYLNRPISSKKCFGFMRICIVCVMIITVALAIKPPDLISVIGAQAFGALCAGFGPVLCLGLRWKRINSKGAIAGMTIGLIFGGILPVVDPHNAMLGEWTPAGLGVILSASATIAVSLITKKDCADIFNCKIKESKFINITEKL